MGVGTVARVVMCLCKILVVYTLKFHLAISNEATISERLKCSQKTCMKNIFMMKERAGKREGRETVRAE